VRAEREAPGEQRAQRQGELPEPQGAPEHPEGSPGLQEEPQAVPGAPQEPGLPPGRSAEREEPQGALPMVWEAPEQPPGLGLQEELQVPRVPRGELRAELRAEPRQADQQPEGSGTA